MRRTPSTQVERRSTYVKGAARKFFSLRADRARQLPPAGFTEESLQRTSMPLLVHAPQNPAEIPMTTCGK